MVRVIKSILRTLGIRRDRLENVRYWLDCRFPTRFLSVWFAKPVLFCRWLQNTAARRTMLCFPDMPSEVDYELVKLSMILGVRLTRAAERPHLAIAWQDTTVRTVPLDGGRRHAGYFLNSRCPDIGKDRVERVFESVFGYASCVDPTTYEGSCVRKSILNATHDGVVITCPITAVEPGFVYQRLINNQAGDTRHVVDLRAVLYRDTIPLVLLKYRPLAIRFANRNAWVTLASADDVWSPEEQKRIRRFAAEMGLDFCNLDILRDNDTRSLYIVDVNTTAFGPTQELSPRDKRRALAILAETFHEQFIAGFAQLVRERSVPGQAFSNDAG